MSKAGNAPLSAISNCWLGGLEISGGLGFASTGWVGAVLALAGLFIFALSVAEEGRSNSLARSGA